MSKFEPLEAPLKTSRKLVPSIMYKTMMRLFFIGLLFYVTDICGQLSQDLHFSHWGFADNREYIGVMNSNASSQTIFGYHLSAYKGIQLDTVHKLYFGLVFPYEFGSEIDENIPNLIAYYQWKQPSINFHFGSFPRYDLLQEYPQSILSDTIVYFDPLIDGIYTHFNWKQGEEIVWVDWTGRQSLTRRESFLAGLSGKIRIKNFSIEHYLTIFHNAGTKNAGDNDIYDNIGGIIFGAYNTEIKSVLLSIQAGWLGTAYRNRQQSDNFTTSSGFLSILSLETKHIGIKQTLYLGAGDYSIMHGDPLYQSLHYGRTDLLFNMIQTENIKMNFNWELDIVGGVLVHSQRLFLKCKF